MTKSKELWDQAMSITEPPGLARSDSKRPDVLTLFPWEKGRCLVWNFTCRNTIAPSIVEAAAQGAGKCAQKAEKDKVVHYQELANIT